jgi:hypothetical protein
MIKARKAGATLQAIGEVLGVTKERVRQISTDQRPTGHVGRHNKKPSYFSGGKVS